MRIGNFGAILLGVIFLGIAAFILLIVAGWVGPVQDLVQLISQNLVYAVIAALVSLILAILAFSLVRVGRKDEAAVASSTALGQLRISSQAIEQIVSRAALTVEGVRELHPRVVPLPEGMNIVIKTVMQPEVVIPAVVEKLQGRVKSDVETYTGLKVTEVKVMVQSIETSAMRQR
ncbi:MAG: alkaline shock response membrane anchor protein AmaP [Peptococcaceae bacterium]|nr:alkaline shock response membrane anchor protein AmaP [Peptococcaceae bacterium]